ncbi:hybrid sensor histidine kinase/response regulator [Leptolyngbyaceae cyanobacterium CCMR0082]|uniref:histidine kinase n=1 Tax=Adonisia turfae CCMR0082 TaxID=2304604 RepID=A0A6M0S7T3_9CYAN|nr:hybrid sensor histidine kinase/response regulator [Adonisia turfae]NEZ64031.1 hybrid sensor histidine kinase/response regulator [Adonisia turfae CCMR0082]
MATDQQVRERFLEESGEYFEQMEQVLLGLPDAENPAQQIDVAMRAAHSLKGGAGMMGFAPMAQVAHRLEDFLKIIRARNVDVDTALETLLLQGVDSLKAVNSQLSSGLSVDNAWIAIHVDPIIEQLRDRLGELSEADESLLLSDEDDIDVAILVFNGGVEEALDTFEANLPGYAGEPLREALCKQANRLIELGLMGGIDTFVELCQSVYDQAQSASLGQMPALCKQALTAWRRSQSLVQLGRMDKLPSQLKFIPDTTPDATLESATVVEPTAVWESILPTDSPSEIEDAVTDISLPIAEETISLGDTDLASLQMEMAAAAEALEILPSIDNDNIDSSIVVVPEPAVEILTEAELLAEMDPPRPKNLGIETTVDPPAMDLPELDAKDLSQLQAAFAQLDITTLVDPFDKDRVTATSDTNLVAPEITPDAISEATSEAIPAQVSNSTQRLARPRVKRKIVRPQMTAPKRTGTFRIAAEDLQQINDLFGTLILERNAINLRQKQLNDFATLLQERMQALESFNVRLRQWYDRSSMESLLPTGAMNISLPVALAESRASDSGIGVALSQDFDALEMDQYSELHLLAQEQMETVVKLQEVTADIRLGLREMDQTTQSLNGTTQKLQNRITRTQMRPISDILGRFPRLIRDLSVQYDKKVKLKIEGETTLFERITLELLADPLTHILRNSFDHGIEPNHERIKAGKAEMGLITIRASQIGNRARMVIRDDGRGINLDKIRDRMRQHNIDEAVINKMSKQELLSVIFDAGFSTAAEVTELSGRGVGMDVVRSNLQQLNGDIQVDTQLGQGTTFTIEIPLSLSVIRIMLLEQESMVFAVPVDAIEELMALDRDQLIDSDQGPKFIWQGQQIPLVQLEDHLTFNGRASLTPFEGKPTIDHPMALIVSHDNGYCAIVIQRYWGEQEVATRAITSPIPLPPGFVGATVLGDGRVVSLVDLPLLISSTAFDKIHTPLETESDVSNLVPLPQQNHGSQPTVLVVDDSVHLRRYLTLTLEKAGYYVEQARDGQEAVDKLLKGLNVQAVLCDVEMPRLDGYGVLDEIKNRPEFKSLPISMLTSRSSEKHRKLAMNLGAAAYFAKPYNEQVLLQTLEKLIAKTV